MKRSKQSVAVAGVVSLVLVVLPLVALAQYETSQWRFGEFAGLSFPLSGSAPPVPVANSSMKTSGGSTGMADSRSANILFYSDGSQIWDRTGSIMLGGDTLGGCPSLNGCSSRLQPVLALRQPGSLRQYVLFSSQQGVFRSTTGRSRDTNYSATYIDMVLNGGKGGVSARNVELWPTASRQLTAIRMCNRDGYWVIGHERTGDRFVVWSFDANGIGDRRTQSVGFSYLPFNNREGYLKSSLDGRRLAVAAGLDDPHVQIIDFDPASGSLADSVALRIWIGPSGGYGISFSPSGKLLYVTDGQGSRISQFDVTSNDSLAVAQSRQTVATVGPELGALQLAPDGKIYCSVFQENTLAVIGSPDSMGAASEFALEGVFLGSRAVIWHDLPNLVEGDLGLRFVSASSLEMCAGDSVRLVSRWVTQPQWEPSRDLSCSSCPQPFASPTTTTTYFLTDGASTGCGPVDSITVNVHTLPEVSVVGDTLICTGGVTTLQVKGGANVRWTQSDGLSCLDCSTVTVVPKTSSTYYFEVESIYGCVVLDSVHVEVLPVPRPNVGPDLSICLGGSVQVRASGGVRYRWSPSVGLSCDSCSDPIASPSVSTNYRVEVTDAAGCVGYDDVRITVLPVGVADAGRDTAICMGESIQLAASGSTTYRWDPSPDLSCLNCADPVARPANTTTYIVTGWNDSGCNGRDSVTIAIKPLPELKLTGDSLICYGGSTLLSVAGAGAYFWRTTSGPLTCPTCPEQFVKPDTTTTYYVEGVIDGCVTLDSITVMVTDGPAISISGGGEICRGGQVQLIATGATSYWWRPSDGLSCTDCASPIAMPGSTTAYTVIGALAGGCTDTATATVTVVEQKSMLATIERGVKVLPGITRTLHVSVHESVSTDSIAFEINWNGNIAVIGGVNPSSELRADQWSIEAVTEEHGRFAAVLRRSAPAIIGPGEVIEFAATAYLGDSTATELALTISASALSCSAIHTRAGQIVVDSICGLSFRLIEASDAFLKLGAPMPNPSRGDALVHYSVPFDATIELRLFDGRGIATTLFSGPQLKGVHVLRIDTGNLVSGGYELQLRVGDEIRSVPVIVVK